MSARAINVLIVDEDESVAEVLKQAVANIFSAILTNVDKSKDYRTVLQMIAENHFSYDIMIMEMRVTATPNGFAVLNSINQSSPRTRIFVTPNDREGSAVIGDSQFVGFNGFVGIIPKPINFPMLRDNLKRVYAHAA